MFTETTITYLRDCIGWDTPEGSSIVVDPLNKLSTSGLVFKSFHSLVRVENVHETTSIINPTDQQLNNILLEFKTQGALKALNRIFDNSTSYNPVEDYHATIVKYRGVIIEVVGLAVCAMVLQSMLTSKRINETERAAKYSMLKVEIEGFRNDQGIQVSRGVLSLLDSAIRAAKDAIFPSNIEIHSYDWE